MKKKTAGRKATTEQQTDLYQQVTDKIIIALENGVPPGVGHGALRRRSTAADCRSTPSRAGTTAASTCRCCGWLQRRRVTAPIAGSRFSRQRLPADRSEKASAAQWPLSSNRLKSSSATAMTVRYSETACRWWKTAMMKPLQLFNVAQCEGLPIRCMHHDEATGDSPEGFSTGQQQQVLEILNATGVKCSSHRQNRAYYSPGADRIVLPTTSQFRSPEDYWSTLLHELVHATGHRSRLDREGITSSSREFGDPVYAFEELIAETGSAFLCAHLGIFGEVQHESYLSGWLSVLRNDKKAFFPCLPFAPGSIGISAEAAGWNPEWAA